MKIALLGNGKTGQYLEQIHEDIVVFNSKNLPTLEKLQICDVIISFLPGEVFFNYIPLLIETKKPVVTGSTGFTWPKDIQKNLKDQKLTWVYAHNFSIGMVIIQKVLKLLGTLSKISKESEISIHEVHHTKKLDAPSGTALSFEKWLGQKTTITSERTGDVVGIHTVNIENQVEKISLTHEAKSRRIFAEGALMAANLILDNKVDIGLNEFNNIIENNFIKE